MKPFRCFYSYLLFQTTFNVMAPSFRKDMVDKANESNDIFKDVKSRSELPGNFVSQRAAERDYGLSLEV